MKNNSEYTELINFVVSEYWGEKEKLTPQTKLEKDLGITGDDGLEFLDKFLKHFKINYDRGRKWQLHFNKESSGFIDFVNIINWIKGKKDNRKHYDLTLEHLTKIIQEGYWIDMSDE